MLVYIGVLVARPFSGSQRMRNVERMCPSLDLGKVGRIIHHFFALR